MRSDSSSEGTLAGVLKMLATEKYPNLDEAARLALADAGLRSALRDGLVSRNEVFRYNCFKVLLRVAEEQPSALHPDWGAFAALLDSDNAFHRSIGVQLIAALACADEERRFDPVFDRYFALLNDEKIMVARHLAQSAGRIAKARPDLRERITDILLGVDETHHKHKDLIKSDVIQAFAEYVGEYPDKGRTLAFVEAQLDSASPRTRKAAKGFLERG